MPSTRVSALLALAVAQSLISTAAAQTPPVNGMRPSDPARHALVGAKVMVAPGTTIDKATVLIRDGVIESIKADGAVPAGYRRFDFAGKTIFPAFIESALAIDSATQAAAETAAPGAHWNQYVTPQVSATDLAIPDATLESLRAQGFLVARVLPANGIFRGGSEIRLLAKGSERTLGRDLGGQTVQVVGPRSFDFSQFMAQTPAPGAPQTPGVPGAPAVGQQRGERMSSYPSSLMGSYALMRQTFMDARWRLDSASVTRSAIPTDDMDALDALLPLVRGEHGLLVDASDDLEAARLVRLAKDQLPACSLSVLGSGNEFRSQAELVDLFAKSNASLIMPIDFPQPPDLVSPTATDSVSLRELMTWRYAPTNPKRFIAAGTAVALTTHRMQDKGSFRKRLADAITHGLTKDEALAALTTTPAKLLGIDARAGTLEDGKLANLIVASGDPFDTESKFEAMFVAGLPVLLPPDAPVLAAGSFTVTADAATPKPLAKDLRIALDPKDGSLKATWTPAEGEKPGNTDKNADKNAATDAAAKPDAVAPEAPKSDASTPTDAPAADAAAKPAAADAKPAAGSATAKRGSVSSDGRASGIFDGTPFGLEGDIRIAIAGSGDRATMTAECADGARVSFTLTRAKPDAPKSDDAKKDDAKTEAPKNDDAKGTAGADASKPTATESATPAAEAKSDAADDAEPSADRPRRRGARGEGRGEGRGDKKPDDRENLWKDTLPVPFGEFGRTSRPLAGTVLFRNATIWTLGPAGTVPDCDMLVRDGKIVAIGTTIIAPTVENVIDAKGMHITPGLIDCHSHTGISGGVNEGTQANTAEVWIGDVIDPTDINWQRQLAGGLTAVNQLHGSANPIGGRNSVVKIRWGEGAEAFRFEGAPTGIKFALGENVTRPTSRYPTSRMGVATYLDDSFTAAREYRAAQKAYAALDAEARARTLPPRTDLELETLAEIIEGTRLVHCHSYRQDEILMLLRTAEKFGFRVATLQHVLEGYKLAPEIAAHGAGASSFSDWWAYKIEVMDAIPWNGAMLHRAGVLVSFNSDSDELARRMNMEAAKAVRYGGLSPEEALKLVTLNPAKQLRIDGRVGSLEPGKDADFAVWNGDPLSAFTRCEETWVDGVRRYARTEEAELHAAALKSRGELLAKANAAADARGGAGAESGGGAGGGGRGFRGGRGRPTLLSRMLEEREDTIWLRIARGLPPIPTIQGDCGCGVVNDQNAIVPAAEAEAASSAAAEITATSSN
jgi:N-acetylglucosamine-6-phosphate deacetylase